MTILEAFENRRDVLRKELSGIQNKEEAAAALTRTLTLMGETLSMQEENELLRQCRQICLAQLMKSPLLLDAAGATAEMVKEDKKPSATVPDWILAAGVLLLAGTGLWFAFSKGMVFLLLQLIGVLLVLLGASRRGSEQQDLYKARGTATLDAEILLDRMARCCAAADLCVQDIASLAEGPKTDLIPESMDEQTVTVLSGLLEAKASGRGDVALRSLDRVEELLCAQGLEIVSYRADRSALFDCLPTLSEDRTVRPAILKDGKLIRRGVAACRVQGGMQA